MTTSSASFQINSSKMLLTKPERIIFLIDIHEEMAENWGSANITRMSAIKAALLNFMRRKTNPGILKHQFSLATFRTSTEVQLVQPFARSFEVMEEAMKSVEPEISDKISSSSSATVDLSSILMRLGYLLEIEESSGGDDEFVLQSRDDFGFVSSGGRPSNNANARNTSIINSSNSSNNSSSTHRTQNDHHPDHLVRTILVYGRSREIPSATAAPTTTDQPYIPLLHHPWSYLDVLYVHLRANDDRVCCQEVFDALCAVHSLATSWRGQPVSRAPPLVLETHASSIKLASHIALLLAHPAQRESQERLESKLDISGSTFAAIRHSIGREDAAAELAGDSGGVGDGGSRPMHA